MDVINAAKTNIADPLVNSVMGIPSALRETVTDKSAGTSLVWAMGGLVGASIVGWGLMKLPMQMLPAGNLLRTLVTGGMGASMFYLGVSNKTAKYSSALVVGGTILAGATMAQILGYTNIKAFAPLNRMLTKNAESGYYGDMNLKNYTPIDSVEVDRSSYQPTQDYGAETIEQQMTKDSPQVEEAQSMVGNNLDSVRQEAAMGHGVTQWFGADHSNSATSYNRRMDMKKFAASTDVGGNRLKTGDDSMANVIGGTSMADSAPSMTAYDVSMEAGIIPTTKELGGGMQDVFDTYILPSYENPSAAGSGHGVTQWYAESNQTGFIGNFVAGAEGHGSVLGQ